MTNSFSEALALAVLFFTWASCRSYSCCAWVICSALAPPSFRASTVFWNFAFSSSIADPTGSSIAFRSFGTASIINAFESAFSRSPPAARIRLDAADMPLITPSDSASAIAARTASSSVAKASTPVSLPCPLVSTRYAPSL